MEREEQMRFLDVAPAGPYEMIESSGLFGAIVFVVLVALVVIAIISIVLLCIRRSRKKKEAANGTVQQTAAATPEVPGKDNKTE